jgi:hypothetical protein
LNRALFCGIGAGLFLAAGIAGIRGNQYTESLCTAINASGRRVVIGTELNEHGQRYKQQNPVDDNNAILEALGGRGPETAWTPESIARCRVKLGFWGAFWPAMFVLAAVFGTGAAISRRSVSVRPKPRGVFLSYYHKDAGVASKLHQYLKDQGISVLIDSETMKPGERIQDFIAQSIEKSEVVVSLVSSGSLSSAWVASETIQSLHRNNWARQGRFIACYLDEAFFAPECRLKLTQQIDERLRRIEELLPDYAARHMDTVDLNEEKNRLYDLRNNLGLILATLKDTLCLDVRDERFDESAKRLIAAIRTDKA